MQTQVIKGSEKEYVPKNFDFNSEYELKKHKLLEDKLKESKKILKKYIYKSSSSEESSSDDDKKIDSPPPKKRKIEAQKIEKIKKRAKISNRDIETPAAIVEFIRSTYGEFDDPCPLGGEEEALVDAKKDGLLRDWGAINFVNPPYNKIDKWLEKGIKELGEGKKSIFLIPPKVCTQYWQKFIFPYASNAYALNGKHKLMLVVFDPQNQDHGDRSIDSKFIHGWKLF